MQIWIDNDGCPNVVRELVLQGAKRKQVVVRVVANRASKVPFDPLVRMDVVPGGFDEADHFIAEQVVQGDLVITSDVPLASRVVAKGAVALSANGKVFDAASIAEQLAMRNLMQELRGGGLVPKGGGAPFGPRDKKSFADSFDRLLERLSRTL